MRFSLCIAFFLLLCSSPAFAQLPRLFRAQLVQAADTSLPVPYAHVVNLRTDAVVVSDVNGHFSLYARLQDTLEVRMIGYRDTTFTALQIRQEGQQIPLRERVYQLRQVNVSADRLTQSFAPAERSADPYVGYKSVRPSGRGRSEDKIGLAGASTPYSLGAGTSLQGGITYLANLLNKKHKQREKIAKLKEAAAQKKYYEALFEYWFPPELISRITELKGSQAERFRNSLKPSLSFLESATEYDIIVFLMERWEKREIQKEKQGGWSGY